MSACKSASSRSSSPGTQAPVKQVVEKGADIDVRRFPAPLHHRMDPGRYITEGHFLTFNRNSGLDNSALQRGWLAGKDEIRVFLGPSTHNAHNLRQYEENGEDMPAAYWIGHHPLVLLGAATHVGPDESHYETAGGTLGAPLRLVPSETLGDKFLVPADAEVVIEGYVPKGQRKPEGPFGEYTRHVGPQRWCPLLKVTAVTYRKNAYWDDVMVGHTHWISSLTKEGAVLELVKHSVPNIKAVHVPMSGCGVSHVYIQMRKTVEGQGKTAAAAALSGFFDIKHAFVFDEDVDIFDEREVLLALATRFQADRGLGIAAGNERIAARSQRARAQRHSQGRLRLHQTDGQTVCRTVGDLGRSAGAHRSAENYRREKMGTDPGRTLGMRENGVMECWSDGVMGSRISPTLQYSSTPYSLDYSITPIRIRSELWLILNMSRARNVMTSLWLARNFFVCRRLTVIVLTAAMNFRSALPPARQPKRRINAPAKLMTLR